MPSEEQKSEQKDNETHLRKGCLEATGERGQATETSHQAVIAENSATVVQKSRMTKGITDPADSCWERGGMGNGLSQLGTPY